MKVSELIELLKDMNQDADVSFDDDDDAYNINTIRTQSDGKYVILEGRKV
jgi:hypothetical protein